MTVPSSDRATRARAVNENWQMSYGALVAAIGGERRRFGDIEAFRTPTIPAPIANGALITEPAQPRDLADAIAWIREAGQPLAVRLEASLRGLAEAALAAGLQREEWVLPGMIMAPIPRAPRPGPGVQVRAVDEGNHDDFIRALVDGGMSREFALFAFGPATIADPNVSSFVAWLDGRIAGHSLLYRTGDVGGVYAVGTTQSARRRGVGTALTWAAVERARNLGCWAATLQATAMGLPVYRAMGFETVVEYLAFVEPGTPTDF